MPKPKISIIAAIGRNREIGYKNKLLWHIADDLKHFQKLTKNHAVIMGQKTYESIGKPLPNRLNVVLSKDKDLEIPGVAICDSLDEAVKIAADYSDEIFVIGGGSIYAQFIDKTDKLYVTLVDEEFKADTFFPEYKEFKKKIYESRWRKTPEFNYKFIELERN